MDIGILTIKCVCFAALRLTNKQLQNLALADIEAKLQSNGSTLRKFTEMPLSDDLIILDGQNKLIIDELSYDREQLHKEFKELYSRLTVEQREFIMKSCLWYQEVRGASSLYMVMEEL